MACGERNVSGPGHGNSRGFCISGFDLFSNLAENADLFRTECTDFTIEIGGPKLTSVTREYGPSVITQKKLPFKSAVALAKVKPWSSWWFPKKENILFAGGDSSTLGKFDQFRRWAYKQKDLPYPGDSLEFEANSYSPNSLAWEGLCDAWSLAALSAMEPRNPIEVNLGNSSVTFNVSDLKALLLKTYEGAPDSQLKYHGEKFIGDNSGWIYPDIFPDQFHRFVEVKLFEKKQAFVMDHDPGPQVWNVPVYKANFVAESVPNKPNAVFITMWIYSAEPTLPTDRELVGTRESVREYQYILQGTRNESGNLIVTTGYWVKGANGVDSRQEHPDYLIELPSTERLKRKSWNPNIEIEMVDWLLRN